MKRSLMVTAILLCLCVGLVACGKEKKVEETSTETTVEESTVDPRFAIKEGEFVYNPDGTAAESTTEETTTEESPEEKAITKELESIAAESEPYVYTNLTGVEEDIRIEAGYRGLLKNIHTAGGISEMASLYDRDILEYLWEQQYFYATKQEINGLLDVIYTGTAEEKAALEEEVLHTQPGWYQDDTGNWIDVYTVPNTDSAINFVE